MKKQNKTGIGAIFLTILALAGAFLIVQIIRLDMIPMKFAAPAMVLIGAIVALIGIFLLSKQGRYQQHRRNIGQIVAMVFSGLFSVLFLLAGLAVEQAAKTMSAVTAPTQISAIVDVYVRSDDSAGALEDAGGYTWGVMSVEQIDRANTEKALSKVQEQLGFLPNTRNYASATELVSALRQGDVDAIMLNNAYISILTELEGYENFLAEVRLLSEFSVEAEPEPETTAPQDMTQPSAPVLDAPEETMVIYLSGSDTRSKVLTASRSDVNILAVANLRTKEVLLLNTPRDYYVPNHKLGDRMDKLAHCGNQGVENSMYALQNLYNVEIPNYAQINFTGFETLIDALGGVTIDSDISFTTTYGKLYIQQGLNYLNGRDALEYARERQVFATGDIARGNHQMQVISAVIDKLSSGTVLTNYFDILKSLEGMFVTNISQDTISELVKMQLDDMARWNVHSYSVTGQGASKITAQAPGMNLYVMLPDQTMISHAQQLIQTVLNGGTLTEADVTGS